MTAGQSQSVASAPPVAPACLVTPVDPVAKVEGADAASIGENVNPVRLEPSLPEQPQPSKSAVNVLGQRTEQPNQQQQPAKSTVDQPPRPRQTTEQPSRRLQLNASRVRSRLDLWYHYSRCGMHYVMPSSSSIIFMVPLFLKLRARCLHRKPSTRQWYHYPRGDKHA